MIALGIDTSGKPCSVSVMKDSVIIGEYMINHDMQHSSILMPMTEKILKDLNVEPSDLSHLAVNIGPGSFTGLRIGISCVKALSKALDIPIAAYDTFRVIAENMAGFEGYVLIVSDALKETFYSKLFKSDKNGFTEASEASVRDIHELKEITDGKDHLAIIGDAAVSRRKLFEDNFPESFIAPSFMCYPKSSALLSILDEDIRKGTLPSTEALPLYMRKPQAVREYEAKYGKFDDNI